MASEFGSVLIVLCLAYGVVDAIFFGWDIFNDPIIWGALIVAIAIGVAGGINIIESGLNSTGTKLAFINSIGIGLYSVLILPSLDNTGIPEPFSYYLFAGVTSCYAIGLFLISSEA